MAEPDASSGAGARKLGTTFAVVGLLAGTVGLFAGGLPAILGTIAALACVGCVCTAKVAEQLAEIRERAHPPWEAARAAEAEPLAIAQEINLLLPEKSWVASIEARQSAGRSR